MCGIFGIVSQSDINPAEFYDLAELNTVRGNFAFGGLVSAGESWQVYRYATPFDRRQSASKIPMDSMTVALGHVRAPTGQRPRDRDDLREVHPFETNAILLAHNGLLLNHTDFPQWRIDTTVAVDSQVIAGGIQHYLDVGLTLHEAIKLTVEALDGQQACWLWHKPTRHIYLWRVMAPIYVSDPTNENKFVFSSVKNTSAQQLLKEGVIYELNPTTLSLSAVSNFAYYNPYHVTG